MQSSSKRDPIRIWINFIRIFEFLLLRYQFLWYLLLWVARLHFVLKNRWQIIQYAVELGDSSCFDVMCRRRACCVVNVTPHLSQNDPVECKLHPGILACASINLFLPITNAAIISHRNKYLIRTILNSFRNILWLSNITK